MADKYFRKNGERAAAEMVATLYDASLDAFAPNEFDLNLHRYWQPLLRWNEENGFGTSFSNGMTFWYRGEGITYLTYPQLNWFGFGYDYQPFFSSYEEAGIKHGSVVVVSSEASECVQVTGVVKDELNKPLENVEILTSCSGETYFTDADGTFSINCDTSVAEITFNMPGYLSEFITARGNMKLDVNMVVDKEKVNHLFIFGKPDKFEQEFGIFREEMAAPELMVVADDVFYNIEQAEARDNAFKSTAPIPPPTKLVNNDLTTVIPRKNFQRKLLSFTHIS
ncbi:MAG: carboxypeptidase regulatory-like domain-containing protein [Bacteroidales bacterium]|nr:carboxypeptidase regulatory-like domain-containing protein [Bacteroidales bacterium]